MTTSASRIAHQIDSFPPAAISPQDSSLLQIPFELISLILTQLKIQDIKNIKLTCKKCQVIDANSSLWQDLFVRDYPHRIPVGITDFKKAYSDQHVREINISKGKYTSHLLCQSNGWTTSLCIADGRLVSGSQNNTFSIWDLQEKTSRANFLGDHGSIQALVYTSGMLIAATFFGWIKILNLKTNSHIVLLRADWNTILSLAAADAILFLGCKDGNIKVLDLNTMTWLPQINHHMKGVSSLIVSKGKLISGSEDNTIKIWDLDALSLIATLEGHTGTVTSLATIEEKLISGSEDKTIRIWDLNTNSLLHILKKHQKAITSLCIANGNLISGSDDSSIMLWNLRTYSHMATLVEPTGLILALAFIDGKLISGGTYNSLKIWDFTASNSVIFNEIADRFESINAKDIDEAKDRFSRMPDSERKKIHEELYNILHPLHTASSEKGTNELLYEKTWHSSPNRKKAQAIRSYLKR